MPKLTMAAIRAARPTVPGWTHAVRAIRRVYEFADFVTSMKFVNAVARLAEKAGHHPDIDIRWNRVALKLTTHEEGGLTDKDFALARQCDQRAKRAYAN